MTRPEDPFQLLRRSLEATSRTRDGVGRFERWRADDPALEDFASIAAVAVACLPPGNPERARCLIGALLPIADDELALSALLVALGPGLGRVAQRLARATGDDWDDAASEVITSAIAVIRELEAEGSGNEAATIVSRTWGRVRRVAGRRVMCGRVIGEQQIGGLDPAAPGDLAEEVAVRADVHDLVSAAVGAGALRADDASLLFSRRSSGDGLGADMGSRERFALLARRRRAEERLARYASAVGYATSGGLCG